MHKLGFVNFWLFDLEEFVLDDGQIMLRGANGSGKSITTQSFIPFLLDGNRSPERLDPFGTRDRRMEYYLLGDGDREESTGYLYMEFKKSNIEDYLTIGIGLRAKKGQNMELWGFCLCDGRRIGQTGQSDIKLYEDIGGERLALSRQKLKNIINDNTNWAESPGEYKKLVNARVFKYDDIKQYEQLINLLIKVRAPKLSKDFKPSDINNILKDSLQILTDEDLTAMVTTMEKMDALEDALADMKAAMKDANIIRTEYIRYNQFILGKKATAYLEAIGKAEKIKNHLTDAKARKESLEKVLKEQLSLKESASALLAQAKEQRAAMGDDDIAEKHRQLEQDRHYLKKSEKKLNDINKNIQDRYDAISKAEIEIKNLEKQLREARHSLEENITTIESHNQHLMMGGEHTVYINDMNENTYKTLQSAFHSRKRNIENGIQHLNELKKEKANHDESLKVLDQATLELMQAETELANAHRLERDERDALTEALVRSFDGNTELIFSEDERLDMRRAVTRYASPADWSPLRDVMDTVHSQYFNALTKDLLTVENAVRLLRKEENSLRHELNQVLTRPEPAPPRSALVNTARTQLAMLGIPCVPFYEAVDFAPGISAERQNLLEAQLTDSGLLDALIVPREYIAQVEQLLDEYPDCFLLPGQAVADPVTDLIPVGEGALHQTALLCLKGFSQSDIEADTALLPDGFYRNGSIKGRSVAETDAGYVGAAARRANRERQIKQLEEQIKLLEQKIKEKEAEAEAFIHRQDTLKHERAAMPVAASLDYALEMTAQCQKITKEKEAAKASCERHEQTLRQLTAQLEQKCRDLCRPLPYARTLEAYNAALETADKYSHTLTFLYTDWLNVNNIVILIDNSLAKIGEQRSWLADLEANKKEIVFDTEKTAAKIKGITEFLNRPDNRERAQRIKTLNDEIEKQDNIQREAENKCIGYTENVKHANEEEIRRAEDLLNATVHEHTVETYFKEDLALGFTIKQEGLTLLQCARQARDAIRQADREGTPETLGESLRNNLRQHDNSLLKYMPRSKLLFDAPSQSGLLRQRMVITFQAESMEMHLQDFINKLNEYIIQNESLLEENDRELFENILTDTISHKLRNRIEESNAWIEAMSALMENVKTSMGLTFSLDWKPKKASTEEELDTARLVTLLNKDRALLTRDDSQQVSAHFRAKLKSARQNANDMGMTVNYADLIRAVLDYRTWYDLIMYFKKEGENRRELTDRAFGTFSGGEKAMAIYLPQFAAVSAQYKKGGADCPTVLALDEAFAGVDDKNIYAMFEMVHVLGFGYIMNSQSLWGCHACVPDINIVVFQRPNNSRVVTFDRYKWNGKVRTLTE